jgi:dynein heavy chain 1
LVHELRITNQLMFVNPSVEDAQYQLLQELFAWEAIITQLPRIQHSRYQVCIQL